MNFIFFKVKPSSNRDFFIDFTNSIYNFENCITKFGRPTWKNDVKSNKIHLFLY